MKGSGWVALGIIVIFIMFMLLRTFYMDAMNYKLKHQQIVLEELGVLETKNTLLLSEKSLFVTWNLSALREIFDAGAKGFSGDGYWHRIRPSDRMQTGKIPMADEIRSYMNKEISSFRGFSGTEKLDAITLRIVTTPSFTIEDAKAMFRVSGTLRAFIGSEEKPSTESPKAVDYTYSFAVNFRGLIGSATAFVNALNGFVAPGYAGTADTYIENAIARLRDVFSASASGGISAKELAVNKAELIVPSANEAGVLAPQGGLLFHYDVNATFEENTPKENQYYYLDESAFEKRPFPLAARAEDYAVALNCGSSPGAYAYMSANDVLCSGDIYTCALYIRGVDNEHLKVCSGGVGERVGEYACGPSGFRTADFVDSDSCYCQGFDGTQRTLRWMCSESMESSTDDTGVNGWNCSPFDKEVSTDCPPDTEPPPEGCKTTVTMYACTRDTEGSCSGCSAGRSSCSVPAGCRQI